jgi:mono/diheme cytochrome c family protein
MLTAILALASAVWGAAPSGKSGRSGTPAAQASAEADSMRVEGERRFQANCGRCHAAPHKFPPRMMATIVRHMRVRATLTDADMKLVLFYMTQ